MGRYFFGVDVPEGCGERLLRVEERLTPLLSVKRWYGPAQFHVTLQFMGVLTGEQVRTAAELAAPLAGRHRAFGLRPGKVGWFPRAKVVWCGLEGDLDSLHALQEDLVRVMAPFGVAGYNHGAFRPHITLGRLHEAESSFRPESVDVSDVLSGLDFQVGAFHLYESVSSGAGGPQYPKRHTFELL